MHSCSKNICGISFFYSKNIRSISKNKRAKMALDRSPEIFYITNANFSFVAFREEFTRISLCLCSGSSPHSLIPCLFTDQNFANNF